jgi:hypothetical protein
LHIENKNGNRFYEYLYCTDLKKRSARNTELIESGKLIYADDVIRVSDNASIPFIKEGVVRNIFETLNGRRIYKADRKSVV